MEIISYILLVALILSIVFCYKCISVCAEILAGLLYLNEQEVREFRDKLDSITCCKERKKICVEFGRKCYKSYHRKKALFNLFTRICK